MRTIFIPCPYCGSRYPPTLAVWVVHMRDARGIEREDGKGNERALPPAQLLARSSPSCTHLAPGATAPAARTTANPVGCRGWSHRGTSGPA